MLAAGADLAAGEALQRRLGRLHDRRLAVFQKIEQIGNEIVLGLGGTGDGGGPADFRVVIFESAWPTWRITHSTSKRLASSAIEM